MNYKRKYCLCMYFLTRLRSQVRSKEVIILYLLYSSYFKSLQIYVYFYVSYDKHVYFLYSDCADSSTPK